MRARCGAQGRTGCPSMLTSPEVGGRRPEIISMAVVLPEPLGPTSTTISPGRTAKETSSRAGAPAPG